MALNPDPRPRRNGMQPDSTYEGRRLAYPDEPVYDQGLAFDVDTLMDRRRVLKLIGYAGLSAGLFALVGCSTSSATASPTGSASPTAAPGATSGAAAAASAAGASVAASFPASCAVIPEETGGPFPGDGSNGPDVLTLSGVVRSDIRSSFVTGSGIAEGIPLTIKLLIQDVANGCAPLAGAAVYLWHCNRAGQYSLYSQDVTNENYLRGVQEAAADGSVTFTSIFPGCYSGRWPHIHFEVYPSLAKATDQANKIATSQIALPQAACEQVYATDGYTSSVANLKQVSLASDNVFGDDGGIHELGTVSGSTTDGLTVTLAVPVNRV